MRFLVLADIHGHDSRLQAIAAAAGERDGVIFVGDLTRRDDEEEARTLLARLGADRGRVLAVPGNMDHPDLLRVLECAGVSLHGAGVVIEGTGFFGVGGSNPTPFHSPFEITEDEIERLLTAGYAAVRETERKVLVTHVPPARCRLDRTRLGIHAGSTAVRRFLMEHEVGLCLCGHIHEAAGEEDVEGARCVNVGAAQDGCYALLDFGNGGMSVTRRMARA